MIIINVYRKQSTFLFEISFCFKGFKYWFKIYFSKTQSRTSKLHSPKKRKLKKYHARENLKKQFQNTTEFNFIHFPFKYCQETKTIRFLPSLKILENSLWL